MNIDFNFACKDDCLSKMVPSDLRKLVCDRDSALRNLEFANERIIELERAEGVAIDERDELHALLDRLCASIGLLFDESFGEHSSANNPWLNAVDYIEHMIKSRE